MAGNTMTNILNLTGADVVLIAESGEKTKIPASGYIASVEYEWRNVQWVRANEILIPCGEQTPREIVVDCADFPDNGGNISQFQLFIEEFHSNYKDSLLLVPREVAEAAASMKYFLNDPEGGHFTSHPLASRMAWADGPVTEDQLWSVEGQHRTIPGEIIGYRELRRAGGVG